MADPPSRIENNIDHDRQRPVHRTQQQPRQHQGKASQPPPAEGRHRQAEPAEIVDNRRHDQIAENHGPHGGQHADARHGDNGVEHHHRAQDAADPLPGRRFRHARQLTPAEEEHRQSQKERAYRKRNQAAFQHAHRAAQGRVDRRLHGDHAAGQQHQQNIQHGIFLVRI